MLKIWKEILPAESEEGAYFDDGMIAIHYHKYSKEIYDYTDGRKYFDLFDVKQLELLFGKRGGFKGIKIYHLDKSKEVFELSKNHKALCLQIAKLFKQHKLPIIKTIVQGEK